MPGLSLGTSDEGVASMDRMLEPVLWEGGGVCTAAESVLAMTRHGRSGCGSARYYSGKHHRVCLTSVCGFRQGCSPMNTTQHNTTNTSPNSANRSKRGACTVPPGAHSAFRVQ